MALASRSSQTAVDTSTEPQRISTEPGAKHRSHQAQSGGKVPENIIQKADAWLRKQIPVEPRAVLALSKPNARESAAANRMR